MDVVYPISDGNVGTDIGTVRITINGLGDNRSIVKLLQDSQETIPSLAPQEMMCSKI